MNDLDAFGYSVEAIREDMQGISGTPLKNINTVRKEYADNVSKINDNLSHILRNSIQHCSKVRKDESSFDSVAHETFCGYRQDALRYHKIRGSVHLERGKPKTFHSVYQGSMPDSCSLWGDYRRIFVELDKKLGRAYDLGLLTGDLRPLEKSRPTKHQKGAKLPFIHCYSRGPPLKWEFVEGHGIIEGTDNNLALRAYFG